MPFISKERLEWLFQHSHYPTFISEKGYKFGNLPFRKSISKAVKDAIKSEKSTRKE